MIQRLTPTGERTHMALASHRTNEVMRVLAIFSALFLPPTFIVGVDGMNFDCMPELHSRWASPAAVGFMGLISTVIFCWFRQRGWLKRSGR